MELHKFLHKVPKHSFQHKVLEAGHHRASVLHPYQDALLTSCHQPVLPKHDQGMERSHRAAGEGNLVAEVDTVGVEGSSLVAVVGDSRQVGIEVDSQVAAVEDSPFATEVGNPFAAEVGSLGATVVDNLVAEVDTQAATADTQEAAVVDTQEATKVDNLVVTTDTDLADLEGKLLIQERAGQLLEADQMATDLESDPFLKI